MNKIKLLIIILTIISHKINSQNYYSTLGHSNEWYTVKDSYGQCTQIYNLGISKTINGKVYKEFGSFEPLGTNLEIGYLREDTVERKIYILPWNYNENPTESILYDFSVKEGDTINLFEESIFAIDTINSFTVDSIRIINTIIDTRNIFYLSCEYYYNNLKYKRIAVWIEGIGSLASFIYPGMEFILDEGAESSLSCFFKDGIHIYQSSFYEECDIREGVNDLKGNFFSIYPNPFNNFISLETGFIESFDLRIIDILGQEVYDKHDFHQNEGNIDLSSLESGIYVVQIKYNTYKENHIIIKK